MWQVFNTLCFVGSHETGIWCCLWHMELGSSPLHNVGRVRMFLSCFVYLKSQNVAWILASIEMVRHWLMEWHRHAGGTGSSESKPNKPRLAHKVSLPSAELRGAKDFLQLSGGNWVCENLWWVSFYPPAFCPPTLSPLLTLCLLPPLHSCVEHSGLWSLEFPKYPNLMKL